MWYIIILIYYKRIFDSTNINCNNTVTLYRFQDDINNNNHAKMYSGEYYRFRIKKSL